jgi:hypothetical protein
MSSTPDSEELFFFFFFFFSFEEFFIRRKNLPLLPHLTRERGIHQSLSGQNSKNFKIVLCGMHDRQWKDLLPQSKTLATVCVFSMSLNWVTRDSTPKAGQRRYDRYPLRWYSYRHTYLCAWLRIYTHTHICVLYMYYLYIICCSSHQKPPSNYSPFEAGLDLETCLMNRIQKTYQARTSEVTLL